MRQSCSMSTSFCNADVAALPLGCDTQRGYRSSARTLYARSCMTERGHAHMHEKGRVVGWGAPRSPCGRRHQSDGQDLRTVCAKANAHMSNSKSCSPSAAAALSSRGGGGNA